MTGFRWAGATHTGQVRSNNQDSWYATDGLFVVADGMGGHQGGEVASAIAIETILESVESGEPADASTNRLLDSVQAANAAIFEHADDRPELHGMGTTLCAVAAIDPPAGDDGAWLAIANVGDSRVYLWTGDELRQVTQDHSLVEDLVRQGRLTHDEAAVHPQRNILTRALGVSRDIDVDYWELPARNGDRYLLCSDGLFNEVRADQLESVLRRLDDPLEVADELVRLANDGGGRDNITVVIADVVDGPDDNVLPEIGGPRVRSGGTDIAGFSTAVAPSSEEPGSADAPPLDDEVDTSRARTPLRTLAWLLAVSVVLAVVVVAVGLYARSNYFVDVADGDVVIYQGRPGGVLWFDPTLGEVTDVEVSDLTPLLLEEVEANPDFASIEGARAYVEDVVARLPDDTADR